MLYQMDKNGTIANMITSDFEFEVKNVENVPHERKMEWFSTDAAGV